MSIGDAKYVSSTTYRKSGTAVATPTWIVPLDGGRVGFRNNPKITMQPSDQRGRIKDGTAPIEGTVELTTSGGDFAAIQSKIRAKYGFMVQMSRIFNTLGHIGKGKFPYNDVGVVITLADEA